MHLPVVLLLLRRTNNWISTDVEDTDTRTAPHPISLISFADMFRPVLRRQTDRQTVGQTCTHALEAEMK